MPSYERKGFNDCASDGILEPSFTEVSTEDVQVPLLFIYVWKVLRWINVSVSSISFQTQVFH